MHDRPDRRHENGLTDPGNRVALFLDFEYARQALAAHASPAPPAPAAVCERFLEAAQRFGRVVLANAYADWTVADADPREFRRRQVEPQLVSCREDGGDRIDMALALDAVETLGIEPRIDVYVVASAAGDLADLLARLRRRGRFVVLLAGRADAGREVVRGADRFVALEDLFGAHPARPAPPLDLGSYDWTNFVRLIRDLSRKLNFVGLRYVATKVLNPHNCGLSDRTQKQELLNRAIDLGILESYQVENIEEGGDPVSACRLNLMHPVVRESLARLEAAAQGAPGSATAPADAPVSRADHRVDAETDELGRPGETPANP
jgi:hypothetical protein